MCGPSVAPNPEPCRALSYRGTGNPKLYAVSPEIRNRRSETRNPKKKSTLAIALCRSTVRMRRGMAVSLCHGMALAVCRSMVWLRGLLCWDGGWGLRGQGKSALAVALSCITVRRTALNPLCGPLMALSPKTEIEP